MKSWFEYSEEDDELLYAQPFNLEAELSGPGAEEVEERQDFPTTSASIQSPPSFEDCALTAPETTESCQVQELREEVLRLTAQLKEQILQNQSLELSLKQEQKLSRDMASRLDQANVLLQNQEDYIYKILKVNPELKGRLEQQVAQNQILEESLQKQKQINQTKSSQLHEANVLMHEKEDYICNLVTENKTLKDDLKQQVQRSQRLDKHLSEKSSQLDQTTALLQSRENYIQKKVMEQKRLSDDLQRLQQNITTLQKDKSSQLNQAKELLQKKEDYIEKLLLQQGKLQRQMKTQSATQWSWADKRYHIY